MSVVPKHKIRRKRLSEELTARLRKYIIDHDLKPGDSLLTEREMVERFGVSHTVVREATKALDFLGIIDAAPRRGMVLDEFDFDRVSDYFGFHFAMSDYPRDKLLKSRAVIETGALTYTLEAMKKDPSLSPRLLELAEAAPDVDRVNEAWIEYDIAFHRGLVDASGLSPLASVCDLLQAFFHQFQTAMGDFQRGKEDHRRIVEALRDEKLDTAVELLRRHLSWYEEHEGAPNTVRGEHDCQRP
ncbi:MAG TPA: FCD domain-containing protein [Thermoguttaceae bacterium]|nr:FCD domain-containing protein [Thermoguttaceae bacterium]